MLPKELKQMLILSGGKLLISDGDLKNSYVLMKLENYLKERNAEKEKIIVSSDDQKNGLTESEVLTRIGDEIESFRRKRIEEELEGIIEDEKRKREEINYEKINF